MDNQFWIEYTIPGESVPSFVPVAFNSYMEGQPKAWHFCDGPYDIFDLYYEASDDEDFVSPKLIEWESVVLNSICPALANDAEGKWCAVNINGSHFIFTKRYLNKNGN
jgi:hypothetical protein